MGGLWGSAHQQQDVLQQGGGGVPLQGHPQQTAGDGRRAQELPAERSPGAQRRHRRAIGFGLRGQLGGRLGGQQWGLLGQPQRTPKPTATPPRLRETLLGMPRSPTGAHAAPTGPQSSNNAPIRPQTPITPLWDF